MDIVFKGFVEVIAETLKNVASKKASKFV